MEKSLTCPVCRQSEEASKAPGYRDHFKCPRCGTLIYSGDTQANAYPDEYFGTDETRKFTGLAGRVRLYWHTKRARFIGNLQSSRGGSVYDIGCGDGLFLEACQRYGLEVHGCEPVDKPRLQAEINLGVPIDASPFGESATPATYDIITAWQVIEHVSEPAALLSKAFRHLNDDGLLGVSTVNRDSWQAKIFGPLWLHLDPPRHLWVGNRHAVEQLLQSCGFRVEHRVWNHMEFGPVGFIDSFFNTFDTQRDRLLKCLKRGFRGYADRALWLATVCLLPVAALASAIEATLGRPATFELYARKAKDLPGHGN